MYQEIEVPEVVIMDYHLRIFDKDKQKVILDRYIENETTAVHLYNEQVNIYHNMPVRVIITLYDLNKCTNIESYDSDDNI